MGIIGRGSNTLRMLNGDIRMKRLFDESYLPTYNPYSLNVPSGGGATTPDQPVNFTTTGVYDIRMLVALSGYSTGAYQSLISQSGTIASGNFRYTFRVDPTGNLRWDHYDASNVINSYLSTAALTAVPGQTIGLRAVIVPTISSVTFYTSPNTVTWTPLGTPVTSGVSAIRTQTNPGPVKIGNDAFPSPALGKYYSATLSIGGVSYLNIDFTQQSVGNGPWTGSMGEIWTRVGTSTVG